MSRLINTILLDLNNVAEDYPSFATQLGGVTAAVVSRLVQRFRGDKKRMTEQVTDYMRATGAPLLVHYPSLWQFVAESAAGRLLSYAEAQEIYGFYLEEYKRAIDIHSDFVPFLQHCRAEGFRTGIVANGNARRIGSFVEKFQIHKFVDTIIASGSTPFSKPSPEIFTLALLNLGRNPNECVFIGDRLDTDVLGANLSGLWSVRLARGPMIQAQPSLPDQVPDDTIAGLDELWKSSLMSREADVSTALIMAGGRGSRMKGLTDHSQKCLLPADEPILAKVLERLIEFGIRRFEFVVRYRANDVVEFVKRSFPGLDARFHDAVFSETGAAVANLLSCLPGRFIYSHGNVVVPSYVLGRLLKKAYQQPSKSWFLATPRSDIASTHPVLRIEGDYVSAIRRFPESNRPGLSLFSIGIGVISKDSLAGLDNTESTTEQLWQEFPGRVGVVQYSGDWWHLENQEDLDRYRESMKRGRYV